MMTPRLHDGSALLLGACVLVACVVCSRQARAQPVDVPPNTWVRLAPDEGEPHPRRGGDVRWSYDERHDLFVMFGGDGVASCEGCDGGSYRRTTWVYDLETNTWDNTVPDDAPTGYPAGRCQPALAFDPVRGVTYMRGAVSSRNFEEQRAEGYPVGKMWAYDQATTVWSHLDTSGPEDRNLNWGQMRFMAYSRTHDRLLAVSRSQWHDTNVFVFHPETLRWDAMERRAPRPDLHRSQMPSPPTVYDDSADRLIALFNVPAVDGMPQRCETWLYSYADNRWEQSASEPQPTVCNKYMGFVHDTANDVSIAYGAGESKDETWVYDAGADRWQHMDPPVTPGGRQQFAMAYSTRHHVVALFGNEPGPWWVEHPVWLYRYAECTMDCDPVDGGVAAPDAGATAVPDGGSGDGDAGGVSRDAGFAVPDAETAADAAHVTEVMSGGCACGTTGASSFGGAWLILAWLLVRHRRMRRRLHGASARATDTIESFRRGRMGVLSCIFAALLAIGPVSAARAQPPVEVPDNTWVRVEPDPDEAHPSSAGDVRWSYDAIADRFVMFGGDGVLGCEEGCGGGSYRRTTWVYHLSSNRWSNSVPDDAPVGFPAGRCQPAMVFDPLRGVTYMRGFFSSRNAEEQAAEGYPVGKLWAYDSESTTWSDLDPPGSPGTEYTRYMAYSREHDRVFLVSRDASLEATVYAYDPGANRFESMPHPDMRPGLHGSGMPTPPIVYDESAHRLVIVVRPVKDEPACETWLYDWVANAWTQSAADPHPTTCNATMGFVYDSANEISILYGAGESADETWVYEAGADRWQRMHPAATPGGRHQFAMAYSARHNVVALFGNEPGDWRTVHPVWLYRYASCDGRCGPPPGETDGGPPTADAGAAPDGGSGEGDAGGVSRDGGPAVLPDAESAADAAHVTEVMSGGCGCGTTGPSSLAGAWLIFAWILVRRRRSGGS